MDYFQIIPSDTFNLIINELDLINLPKLSRTNKYFNNINFTIESKINSLIPKTILLNNWSIKFILLNKWSTMIYTQNPKFLLSKKIIIIFEDTILLELIKRNLTFGTKMLLDHTPKLSILSQKIIYIVLKNDCFSSIKYNKNTEYTINQTLLVLTYLYGTEDMLNFLLKSNIIKSINNYKTIYSGSNPDLGSKNNDQSDNLLGFIDKMELINKWNCKNNIYQKISLSCIFQEIATDNISLVLHNTIFP
jgi:hypothetical protein